MPKIIRTTENPPTFMFWCPACECGHGFKTEGPGPAWTWNGDYEKPTVNPSLSVNAPPVPRCHFYLIDGFFQYSSDSGHALAARKVPMVDWNSVVP